MKRLFLLPLLVALSLSLTACIGYRPDMAQGQNLTMEQVQSVHIGMLRQQVSDRLGSPVLASPLNPHTMIYIYTMLPRRGKPYQKQLILTMRNNRVTHIKNRWYA